jgi:hypothetical protein
MTDASPTSESIPSLPSRLVRHPVVLWAAFVLVHFWLGMLGLYGIGLPLGDVTLVYRFWVEHGLQSGTWVGIDTAWVYPIVALVPMLISYLFGPDLYASTWLSLVMLIDAVAFAVLIGRGRDRRVAPAGWWWLLFLVLLGPVALGRIDSITVPVAIVGVLVLMSHPRLAGVLLTIATWIKVWPAALIAAAIVAVRSRVTIAITAAIASAVIIVVVVIAGGAGNIFSFIFEQTGRGLQVESPIATFWMWDAFATHSTRSIVYYDQAILTYQVVGPGSANAASVMTPIMAVVTAALLVIGLIAHRRGVPVLELLPPLMLAITTALMLFNKVGSPQFVTWLAVAMVFGLSVSATGHGPSFRTPVVLTLVIAGLTQAIYPYLYSQLLGLNFTLLLVLSARNVLYIVLLFWAVITILDAIRNRREPE